MVATIAPQSSTPKTGLRPTVRRTAVVATALGAAALTACTVHPGVNYNQWGPHAGAVMILSSACPAAAPFTYPGHDPRASDAVDFMLPGGGYSAGSINCGYAIANTAVVLARNGQAHYTVFRQRIWNIQRANEGWRLMENRGSRTQNHMDHVHVSFY